MEGRTNEIIKHLNRLVNDRNLNLQARNRIREAILHIKHLQQLLSETTND
jgi:hypothetical protein